MIKTTQIWSVISSILFSIIGVFGIIAPLSRYDGLFMSLVILGISSSEFHLDNSTKNTFFHRMDEASMYMVGINAVLVVLEIFPEIASIFYLLFITAGFVVMYFLVSKIPSHLVIPGLIGMTLTGMAINYPVWATLIAASLVITAEFMRREALKRESDLHLADLFHAAWHVNMALAIIFVIPI